MRNDKREAGRGLLKRTVGAPLCREVVKMMAAKVWDCCKKKKKKENCPAGPDCASDLYRTSRSPPAPCQTPEIAFIR